MKISTKINTIIALVLSSASMNIAGASEVMVVKNSISSSIVSVYDINKGTMSDMANHMREFARDVSDMVWDENILGKANGHFYEKSLNEYLEKGDFYSATLVVGTLRNEILSVVMKEIQSKGGYVNPALLA